jgi:hypothetical protein
MASILNERLVINSENMENETERSECGVVSDSGGRVVYKCDIIYNTNVADSEVVVVADSVVIVVADSEVGVVADSGVGVVADSEVGVIADSEVVADSVSETEDNCETGNKHKVVDNKYNGIWSSENSDSSSDGYDDINSTYCYVISVDDKPYAYNTNLKRVKDIMNELSINFCQEYMQIYTVNTVECSNGSLHIVGRINNTLITYDQVLKVISYSRVKWLS